MEYKLLDPIRRSEKETPIEVFTLEEPKTKHFRNFPTGGQTMGDMANIIGQLSGQPPSVIDELSLRDLKGLTEILTPFL